MPVRLLLGSGLVLVGIGLITMTAVDAASSWTALIPGFVLAGAGIGLVNPPLASTAIGVVPAERSGMASGINSTFRQVGIATGIAGLGAVFQHSVTHGTTAALLASGHAREIRQRRPRAARQRCWSPAKCTQVAHSLSPAARTALDHAYRVGFTEAFTTIAMIAALVALVGVVLAFVLVRGRDFVVRRRAAPAARSRSRSRAPRADRAAFRSPRGRVARDRCRPSRRRRRSSASRLPSSYPRH